MMTIISILLMSLLSLELAAAPLPRPRPRPPRRIHYRHPRPNPVGKAISRVPWQTVLAGGAAASGIVFAYKVSDGIQKGTMEAAGKEPGLFLDRLGGITGTMQIICGVCVLAAAGYFVWRVYCRCRKPPDSDADDIERPSP